MLADGLWHELGLEPQAVRARADFFEAFAKLVAEPSSPQPRQLAELSRFTDPRPGLEAFGNPPGAEDMDRFEDGERELPAAALADWQREGFEADALRQAAIAALLVDTERGLELLRQASERFRAIDPAFALFLRAAVDPSSGIAANLARRRLRAHYLAGDYPGVATALGQAGEIHLALAASSVTGTADPETYNLFIAQPGGRSPAPFGTGGAAVFEWWGFAASLLSGALQMPIPRDRRFLATELVHLARGHGRQLVSARLDSFHWRKFAGIPDLIDLEVACAVCLVNRQLAALESEPLSSAEFEELTDVRLESPVDARQLSLAQISLQVGVEMTRPDEELGPVSTSPAPELNL
ncbi:MAG TPA: hypothetical protein VFJ61_01880 [Solirubrobacterales bacterium]|nr:hypothetical protein [Solirubrobacterales bacterium]